LPTSGDDKTSILLRFRTYRVGRSQLDRVISIATEGFEPDDISFKTTRSSTTLERRTLDELISAVATSPLPGDPEIWPNLEIVAHRSGNHVAVEFDDNLCLSVYIRSADATWVHGQSARFKLLLESVAHERDTRGCLMQGCAPFGMGALAWLLTFLLMHRLADSVPAWANALCATVASLVTFLTVGTFVSGGEYNESRLLNVVGEVSNRGWWRSRTPQEKIALAGVAVATITAISALLSAYANVWGGH
jgi:hypothetical protein